MGSRLHGNDGGRRRTPHGRRQCTPHGRRQRAHVVIPATGGRRPAGTTAGSGECRGPDRRPAPFMPLPLLGYSMGMAGTRENLTAAVESYLADLRRVRASGGLDRRALVPTLRCPTC